MKEYEKEMASFKEKNAEDDDKKENKKESKDFQG